MCFGGGDDTQTSTSTTNIPAWATKEAKGQIGMANTIANTPWQPYTGPRVADWTPQMMQASNTLDTSAGSWRPALDWSTGGTMMDTGFQAPNIGAQGWQDFFNPNMQAVYDQI